MSIAIAIGLPCALLLALCFVDLVLPERAVRWIDRHILGSEECPPE